VLGCMQKICTKCDKLKDFTEFGKSNKDAKQWLLSVKAKI